MMKGHKKIQLGLALSAVLSGSAVAETFNYSNISVGYSSFSSDIDGVSEDLEGNGIVLDGSLAVHENFAVVLGYARGTASVTLSGMTLDSTMTATRIGGYFHTPVSPTTDVVVGADVIQSDVDMDVNGSYWGSEEVNGRAFRAGVRSMVSNNVELKLSVNQSTTEGESDSSIIVGGAFHSAQQLSINGSFTSEDDGTALTIGVAKYF